MPKEPNIKDKHKDSPVSQEFKDFFAELRKRIDNDDDNRIGWKRKLLISNNQRLGIKRVSTRPWRGAPNIPLPEADKLILKKKPNFVLSAFTPKKKAFVRIEEGVREPDQFKEQAKRAEAGLNHVLNNKIDLLRIFDLASDNFLEKGHAIFKVIERFTKRRIVKVIDLDDFPDDQVKGLRKLNKQQKIDFVAQRFNLDSEDEQDKKDIDDAVEQFTSGKTVIEFSIDDIESFPDIIVRPGEKIIVPSFSEGIGQAERITDEFFETKRQLVTKANLGIYNKTVIDKLDKDQVKGKGKPSASDDMIEATKEQNEGVIDENADELFRIREAYIWWRPEGKDDFERWVITYLADIPSETESIIQMIQFPYEFKDWNFIKHDNEVKDSRYYASRGDPERIRALQEFMEQAINNMLIRDQINNSPAYTVLSTSNIQSNTIRFIPGQKIKVKSHNEIARLDDSPKVDLSSERIQQILKAYAEEYMSSTDQLFRNATNKGGGKTLGEVKIGVAAASSPNVVDVLRWLVTLGKLYTMVFKLLAERLGESMFIDGMEITKEDFNIPATITANGSIELAEQATRESKAAERLNFTIQGPPDIVTSEDRFNAAMDWLEAQGVQEPNRFITDPKEILKQQQEQGTEEDKILTQQEEGLTQEIDRLKSTGGAGGTGQAQGTQ